MKFKPWPYSSTKYIQLALVWSLIIHCFFIFYITQKKQTRSAQKPVTTQLVYIEKSTAKKETVALPDPEAAIPASDTIEKENSKNISADTSLIDTPISINSDLYPDPLFDTPAKALKELDHDMVDGLPEFITPGQPLIEIKIWIDATGMVAKTVILNTQLDDYTSKKMAAKIGGQLFIPAIKNGKGVSSTKVYSMMDLSSTDQITK